MRVMAVGVTLVKVRFVGDVGVGEMNEKVLLEPLAAESSTVIVPAVKRLATAFDNKPSKVGAGTPLCGAVTEPTVPGVLLEEKPMCGSLESGSAAPSALMVILP